MGHVIFQLGGVVDDLHGPAPQHVAGAHHQRVANRFGFIEGFRKAARRGIGWLLQAQLVDHHLEAFTVFCAVDGVRCGTNDRHTGSF